MRGDRIRGKGAGGKKNRKAKRKGKNLSFLGGFQDFRGGRRPIHPVSGYPWDQRYIDSTEPSQCLSLPLRLGGRAQLAFSPENESMGLAPVEQRSRTWCG